MRIFSLFLPKNKNRLLHVDCEYFEHREKLESQKELIGRFIGHISLFKVDIQFLEFRELTESIRYHVDAIHCHKFVLSLQTKRIKVKKDQKTNNKCDESP